MTIDGESYSCSKGGGAAADCTVVRDGQSDKYGTYCSTAYSYCAKYYKYGSVVNRASHFNNAKDAANWCDGELSKN